MERLTTSQLAQYSDPLAFSVRRSTPFGAPDRAERGQTVTTKDLEASYRLTQGALGRLESIESNLLSVLKFAREGLRGSTSARRKAELIGLMRSLTAGIDEIIDLSKFNDQKLFSGGKLRLATEFGQPILLDLPDLQTFKAEAGGIARRAENAEVAIFYDDGDRARNEASGLFGLTVEKGSFIPPKAGYPELEDGIYRGEIVYEGNRSTVILRNESGLEVGRANNIDLSGTGKEWVDFDVGVRLEVDKLNLLTGLDKYDFETKGPASHRFSFGYERLHVQELGVASGAARSVDNVRLFSSLPAQRGHAELSIKELSLNASFADHAPVPAGTYLLEVNYNGAESSVLLKNLAGHTVSMATKVDLRENGRTTVSLPAGLRVVVDNQDFTGQGRASALVEVQRARELVDDFDFKDFVKKVEATLGRIGEHRRILEGASIAIEDHHLLRNMVASGVTMPVGAFLSVGAANVLSGNGNLFSGVSSLDSQLKAISSSIFQNTSGALSTQTGGAAGPVSMFAMLGQQSPGGGIFFG